MENGLILDPAPEVQLPPPLSSELYNLATDPGETLNPAEAHPEILSRLEASLDEWFDELPFAFK